MFSKIKNFVINIFADDCKTSGLDKKIMNGFVSNESEIIKGILVKKLLENISVGDVFENPGGGTSTVINISEDRICYRRGKSNIYLNFKDIEEVYNYYKGRACYSNDLKKFRPTVFDSSQNGHSCNCAFLFKVFSKLELLEGDLEGRGVRGDPFYVEIKDAIN